jgi:hypothetical protein
MGLEKEPIHHRPVENCKVLRAAEEPDVGYPSTHHRWDDSSTGTPTCSRLRPMGVAGTKLQPLVSGRQAVLMD